MTQGVQPTTEAIIALGGNVGDVAATLSRSIERLHSHPQVEVLQTSRTYKTSPVGKDSGGPFLNSAIRVQTSLDPEPLLDELQRIEFEEGRERTFRWSPRPIDLDIICFGDQVIETDRLQIPHPGLFYRRFVLDPVVEIAADWIHPQFKVSLNELRNRLLKYPLIVGIPSDEELRKNLRELFDPYLIRFQLEGEESTVITFCDSLPESRPANCIVLDHRDDSLHQIHQFLIAATDEPRVM